MNFTGNCDTQELSKFKKDTLTTLKLVKKYNPTFVTTFVVSNKEAHTLTGDDLRRCENMITLKKKREINAKYSGLLKSKVKQGICDIKIRRKSSARVEKQKVTGHCLVKTPRLVRTPRQVGFKNEKDLKSDGWKLRKGNVPIDCNKKKSDFKQIFKSKVYSNLSTSTLDDTGKCPNGKFI